MPRPTLADLAALLAGCVMAAALWFAAQHTPDESRPAPTPAPAAVAPAWSLDPGDPAPARCAEDEPCWDCRTMGNRVCGQPAPEELTACVALGECIPDPTPVPSCTLDVVDGPVPCVGSDRVDGITVTDAFGTVHAGCDLIITTLEDSVVVCPDGFREQS